MHRRLSNTLSQGSSALAPRPLRSGNGRKLVHCLTLTCVSFVLASAALRASADTHIFLYDANGTPVDSTATYLYQDHHLYDMANNCVGIVDTDGAIYNSSDQLIGYLETTA